MGATCSPHRRNKKTYTVFEGKPEHKLLGRPRQSNFKVDLKEVELEGVD
jgi:hypothetical protein